VGWPRGTSAVLLALALALLASGGLLVVPTYTGVRASAAVAPGQAAAPRPAPAGRRATLLEGNGPGVLGPLAAPVVLTALPVAANWTALRTAARALAAVLLTGFALATGFSIGLCYLPAAGALPAAVLWGVRPTPAGRR
jgi:hypothetical protein